MKKPNTGNKKPKTVYAKKSFGQNFLVDQNYINKIISALNPQPDETIVEIGAGRGALTEKLIESGANVVAVELEREMIAVLKERFDEKENFRLIESDALKVDFWEISQNPKSQTPNPKSKLVANLPYYISTAILQRLIEQRDIFSGMILMFQREVVERITAGVGSGERGFLTVLVETYLEAEKLFDVPPTAFRPAPKVWSAVASFAPKKNVGIENEELFREIVSAGFAQRRKTILNNLKTAPAGLKKIIGDAEALLEKCDVEKRRRAETLAPEEWKCLARAAAAAQMFD
jgi:16S rRNA (adenine1518-N6/adenine1519-N6)-dimethyltransferase